MNLIELHIVQSFPVTCLNRDDVGAPKSAVFGGVQRSRVSSQSWKRAIRYMAKDFLPGSFAGTRTRFVVRELKRAYLDHCFNDTEAQELAESTADAIGKLDNVEKGSVKTLLYFSPMELESVVADVAAGESKDLIAECVAARGALADVAEGDKKAQKAAEKKYSSARGAIDKLTKKATGKLKDAVKDGADISIFGRMVADDHSLMVEGAGLFSHAISTHKSNSEVEFFSAVDDKLEMGDEGAGHIGTLEFSSACYYRYIGLNLDLLQDHDHLKHFSDEELGAVIDAFLRAALLAVPEARKNSMFGFTAPSFVLGLRRKGQPLSLVNAFEKPVKAAGKGYVDQSVEVLEKHFEAICKTYKLEVGVQKRLPEVDIDELIGGLIQGPTTMEG
jgi:CRISPR system Cascade subunit CasC